MTRLAYPAGALVLLAAAPPAAAPAPHTAPAVPCAALDRSPRAPRQGTLFRVSCRAGDGPAPEGRVSATGLEEPLHFARGADGAWLALVPVPVDLRDSLTVEAWPAGASDSRVVSRIPVAAGSYPTERLRVAPEFGREPDAATRARMDAEAKRAREVARGAHETPRLWTRPFARPRPSRITSPFGRAREFNGAVTSRHMGTDFAGRVGDVVRASNRGVVRLVDRFFLGGNVVYLDHGAGLTTAYLHLSRTLVAVGDTVARGQPIGRVGATGRVTGPHLHFIVRYGEVTVDPGSLLGSAGGDAGTSARGE